MEVIRHQDITPDSNVVLLCSFAKGAEGFMDFNSREQMQSLVSIESHKEQRLQKQAMESRRPFWVSSL